MANKFSPNPRTYTKRTFVELLETITPEIYLTEDINLSGVEVDPVSEVINSHVVAAANISSILSVSAVSNSQTSALSAISGISQYFVKQNELTKINTFTFEDKFLIPLNTKFADFATSGDFHNYLSGTLLPKMYVEQQAKAGAIQDNVGTLSALTSNSNPSSVHNYLVDNLGWFYFLNTSADGGLSWDPSSYVLSSLTTLFSGEDLGTLDGVKGFQEYIWRNYATCTTFSDLKLIPDPYVSGLADTIVDASSDSYLGGDGIPAYWTSGTQKLDNLQTFVDVIYSNLYIDQQDFRVQEAFDDYIGAGVKLNNLVSKGPFRKFLTAMGYSLADFTDELERIGLLFDIENIDEEYLQYLAHYIGWSLFGHTPDKWRQQLRLATDFYKKKGTKPALNFVVSSIISDTLLDVGTKVSELWESYLPYLIWYSLLTESPHFKDLETWNAQKASQLGLYNYDSSSLEGNIKLAVDKILLDLCTEFPDNFIYLGETFPVSKLVTLGKDGKPGEVYTYSYDMNGPDYHIHKPEDSDYETLKELAYTAGLGDLWIKSLSNGPLGWGVYMTGATHTGFENTTFLQAQGDINFVFNYRQKENYPIPPFEEIKYYEDGVFNAELIEYLVERLVFFGVRADFAEDLKNFLLENTVNSNNNLGTLNSFLLFFLTSQVPPNYNEVLFDITKYAKDPVGLWSGKSSHLYAPFESADFDFTKTSLAGDGKYGLYEASRLIKRFSPAHAIPLISLSASTTDDYETSSTIKTYLSFSPHDDGFQASAFANYEISGVAMGTVSPGTNLGRGGLNTFKRQDVDLVDDVLVSSTQSITSVPRRSLRRRNLKNLLPLEGYYDRTGFNAPVSWDASVLEESMPSSLGELTLGYVPSANAFYPIVDPIHPSGVWHLCENLNSPNIFSGAYTSATFPYRGISELGSDAKNAQYATATDGYVDRGQLPLIYKTMHDLYSKQALFKAEKDVSFLASVYAPSAFFMDNIVNYANSSIASGLVLNSFDDYTNFKFGKGVHTVHADYCKYFEKHGLSPNNILKTGGNIIAQVYGKGLYNGDFDLAGSAATNSIKGSYIGSSFDDPVIISHNFGAGTEASGVFSTCAVAAYSDSSQNLPASGTYIASSLHQVVLPTIDPTYDNNFVFTDTDPITGALKSYVYVEGQGSGVPGVEFRNPHILSGVEFVDCSGLFNSSADGNKFFVYKVDKSKASITKENFLINNAVVKCKSHVGIPRLRFDLSSYGDRRNYFIKDHNFKLKVNALAADENSVILGGQKMGVWIHTEPLPPVITSNDLSAVKSSDSVAFGPHGTLSSIGDVEFSSAQHGYMWSWTRNNTWEMHDVNKLTIADVKHKYSHTHTFPIVDTTNPHQVNPPINTLNGKLGLEEIRKDFFDTLEIDFNTKNYFSNNNYELGKNISIPKEFSKTTSGSLVHTDDTNYVVEVFFYPTENKTKYLLIDNVELQDVTQRENAAIGTGVGIETSGIPFRKFVQEEKLYLTEEELTEILKFYNGLIGQANGVYATNLASRDASISITSMDVSGGSRLNYRTSPIWVSGAANGLTDQITGITLDN